MIQLFHKPFQEYSRISMIPKIICLLLLATA
ncbi:unnamed protein product, partial [Allacma fusca]